MGLNLSNCQIAKELGLNEDDAHVMATHLREGLVAKVPDVVLDGEVEADEVYVIAGHKGNAEAVKKRPQGSLPPSQGCARTRHFGEGKTAYPWLNSTRRPSHSSYAGQC